MVRVLQKEEFFHPDGFPIAVVRREPERFFEMHSHAFSELVLITGGRGVHATEEAQWPLGTGDAFVIDSEQSHEYRDIDDLRLINVLFDEEGLELERFDALAMPGYQALFRLEPDWRRRHRAQSRLSLTPEQLNGALELVGMLEQELQARRPGFGLMAHAVFMQLVGYLARCYDATENPDSRALLRLGEAITHLHRHWDRPLTIDELAEIADMPKRSFMRAFQAALGTSPIRYLIRLKLDRAATLLRTKEMHVNEVAAEVGFSDSNYFTRQFRRAMGDSPRSYQRRFAAQRT